MNNINNKQLRLLKISFLIFSFPIIMLFTIKIFTFFKSYDLYVTSGAEITTLNFLYNFLNDNNLLKFKDENILYEFYGLNFHLMYFPFVKFFELFNVNYLFSSRIITTLLIVFILPVIIIKIAEKISSGKSILISNKKIFYFIFLLFLINHQSSSWWIITYRPDILAIILSFFAIYLFFNFIEKNKKVYFILSTFLCVISWTLKQNYLFTFCSIFIYLLYKRNFLELVFFNFLVLIFILLINFFTEYNNFDLLSRSPATVVKNLEFQNYISTILKYTFKNPYLIFLVFLLFNCLTKKIDNKKIFYSIIIFFLFLQSTIGAIIHSAGFNHLMVFLFFILTSVCFIEKNFLIKYINLITIFLIFSSVLNYFQLFNYNMLGRQGLFFNNLERKEMIKFKDFIQKEIKKPAVILGASNRTEMFSSEKLLGKNTFQITSYLDNNWKAFIWRSKNDLKTYNNIFKKKFEKINTVLVLEDINNKVFLTNQLDSRNFKLVNEYTINVYERKFLIEEILKLFKLNNKNSPLKQKRFLVYQKIIY